MSGTFDPRVPQEETSLNPSTWELLMARHTARTDKNFAEADSVREELEKMGVTLKDAKDPKTGELVTTWEVAR